ncbi:hypothetical protein pb186bvf_018042 [Paramecium bursaria]
MIEDYYIQSNTTFKQQNLNNAQFFNYRCRIVLFYKLIILISNKIFSEIQSKNKFLMPKDNERTIFFFIINIQTYIDIALGISAIIISTVLQIRLKEDFSYFNGYQENISSLMKTMWALSSFILFWGLITFICCYNQLVRPTCLKIFPLSIFIWTLVFGIFVFIAKGQFNNMNQNCLKVKWSENLESTSIWAKSEFCSSDCQCYIANIDLAIQFGLKNYTLSPSVLIQNLFKNVTKVQNCQEVNAENHTKQIGYLSHVEEKFECAGWCSNQKYYMFSDINNQVPQTKTKGCSVYAAKYIDNNLFIQGVFSFVVMAFQAFYLLVSGIFHHIINPKEKYGQID